MATQLDRHDILLDDSRLLSLVTDTAGVEGVTLTDNGETRVGLRFDLSRERILERLKADPDLGARFLSATSGGSRILWTGDYAANRVDGNSFGVRVYSRRDGMDYVGDNVLGRLLDGVRADYLEYMRTAVLEERPVRDGQVIVDFTRKGSFNSDVTLSEMSGNNSFIHVDAYTPSRFRFDAGRDGTTGHAGRDSDADVDFHSFVCPFGTGPKAAIRVGSAAEEAYLYEKALRGELDWASLLGDLRNRGLASRQMSGRELEKVAARYRAQFAWMREQICRDTSLRGKRIVASSGLVADSSYGRSVYDARLAPSPAQVLARYINNPGFLFSPSENGVARALSVENKAEPQRISVDAEQSGRTLNVVVFGSDTIGGRIPGRKASTSMVTQEQTDTNGRRILVPGRKVTIPMKDREQSEADYRAFSARMDEVLSELPEGVKVRFITGSASTLGDSIGIGTPRMVERYVAERGGQTGTWNFSRGSVDVKAEAGEGESRFSAVLMEHFADCVPALVGAEEAVEFKVTSPSLGEDEYIRFHGSALGRGDAALCFSVAEDSRNANVLSLGSYAGRFIPVVHVQENRSEQEQADALKTGALLTGSSFLSEVVIGQSLFGGELRTDWAFGEMNDLSFADPATGFVIPDVLVPQNTPVSVDGVRFNNVFSVFAALAAKEAGGGRETLIRISADQMSLGRVAAAVPELSAEAEERLMVQAVRLMAGSDSAFSRYISGLDGRPVVFRSSVGCGRLFADPQGHGENRFGAVFAAEGRRLKEIHEANVRQEEEQRRLSLEENARKQKLYVQSSAEGEKVRGGLPNSIAESRDAVWFLGTASPDSLAIPGTRKSFALWDDDGGTDRLTRDKASAGTMEGPEGTQVSNDLVFLFPSDMEAVTGRRRVVPMPDSLDLTGMTRVDPVDGKPFTAAFGIPVKMNNRSNELDNDEGFRCSFRLDNDSSAFVDSLVLADGMARSTAIRHNMRLCVVGRGRLDGTIMYPLGQVFQKKFYGYDRGLGEKRWMDSPHYAPANAASVDRYTSMLERGSDFPLNCIVMPSGDYRYPEGDETFRSEARMRFMADFNISLKIANTTAVALGVPLRFPLGPDGRVDLGPGVPDEFCAYAEERINSVIGVVNKEDITTRALPVISTVSFVKTADKASSMTNSGSQLMLRPLQLVAAFGPFESDDMIREGQRLMPLHRMDFVMSDAEGNDMYFSLRDSKTTKGMRLQDINESLRYENNTVRSFIIHSTHPEAVPQFKAALKGYVERAELLDVEWRIVGSDDREAKDFSLDGFVDVKPSYEYENPRYDYEDGRQHSVGKPVDILGARGRLDGGVEQDGYAGKVRARDGFAGYAQVRWTFTNGKQSGWHQLGNKHLELAKDMIMSAIRRDYPYEYDRVVPSPVVLKKMMTAVAVEMAGDSFRMMRYASPGKNIKEDSKVVSIEREAVQVCEPERMEGRPAASAENNSVTKPVPAVETAKEKCNKEIAFSESAGGYARRTRENASADGVDFTLQLAADFNTFGERCTVNAAGDSLVSAVLPVLGGGGLDLSSRAVSEAVDRIAEQLPREFLEGEPCGLNIAGNGIYTLAGRKVTQEMTDEFVTRVLAGLRARGMDVALVRTGGQTGVDEAGAAAALALGIPAEVHAPKGWLVRDASNRDISGEDGFKRRFEEKDYVALAKAAEKDLPAGESVKETVESAGRRFDKVLLSSHDGPWTRAEAESNPSVLYVFTDNTDRDSGRGVIGRDTEYYKKYGNGMDDLHFPTVTAAVIRGLDNAMPVSTQRWYHAGAKGEGGRWSDEDVKEFRRVVSDEFSAIREKVSSGRYSKVMFPGGDGLFNGKISAITKERTPKLHSVLEKEYKAFRSFIDRHNGRARDVTVDASRKNLVQVSM